MAIERGGPANEFEDYNLIVVQKLIIPDKTDLTASDGARSFGLGPNDLLVYKDHSGNWKEVPITQVTEILDGSILTNKTWSSKQINDTILASISDNNNATVADLLQRVITLQAAVNGDDEQLNSIKELADRIKSDDTALVSWLASKVSTTDIANSLNIVLAGKVLDARQGKALSDMIADTIALVGTNRSDLELNIQEIATALNAIPPPPTRATLGISFVDNTPDLKKPTSEDTQAQLDNKADDIFVQRLNDQLQVQINELAGSKIQPWQENIVFTYDGKINTFDLGFAPKLLGVSFLNGFYVNALSDYYFLQKTVTVRKELLTLGQTYKLSLSYYK